jgi:hypothetical protein
MNLLNTQMILAIKQRKIKKINTYFLVDNAHPIPCMFIFYEFRPFVKITRALRVMYWKIFHCIPRMFISYEF